MTPVSAMQTLNQLLRKKIDARKQDNAYRALAPSPAPLKDFCSNDYLGLARSPDLYDLIIKKLDDIGVRQNGATGSRLLSGNTAYTLDVERTLAGIFNSEAALIFNAGYTANVAVLSAIPRRGDTILYDEFAHASIKDGARLSLANRFAFRHNDLEDLVVKIKNARGEKYIVVESVYSMDGDECPLKEIVMLAKEYGAHIILDEAHTTGVVGPAGSGLAVASGVEQGIDVRIYTFGKAMGVHGACVAGSATLIDYLVNFARPFIYTTALPPHSVASIDCAFQYLGGHPNLQHQLQENVHLFTQAIWSLKNRTVSNSPIQTAIFPGNDNVKSAAGQLVNAGFDVRPILSPTVRSGQERLRICLHAFNETEDLLRLASLLGTIGT
ncbi:MAG TPA: pyridoxal phosphate-dependent aminotransferase family protein [Ohtaekwangia sp.]|nr:pyridoxal phosphate-dependent aminotransferase family protein [Ohtaekwangia sp.]